MTLHTDFRSCWRTAGRISMQQGFANSTKAERATSTKLFCCSLRNSGSSFVVHDVGETKCNASKMFGLLAAGLLGRSSLSRTADCYRVFCCQDQTCTYVYTHTHPHTHTHTHAYTRAHTWIHRYTFGYKYTHAS